MSPTRTRFAVVAAAALALAAPLAIRSADAATTPTAVKADSAVAPAAPSFTAAQVLAGVKKNMTTTKKVNSKPHINTMTRAMNVNVYSQTSTGHSFRVTWKISINRL